MFKSLFGAKKQIEEIKANIELISKAVNRIISGLILIRKKDSEQDESIDEIMKMIADSENNNNARFISTQKKLIIFEKIIRENKLDKKRLLDKDIN